MQQFDRGCLAKLLPEVEARVKWAVTAMLGAMLSRLSPSDGLL
jgi:hypothetical protein